MNAPTHSAFANTAEEAIAAQDALDDPMTSEKATEVAMQNTLLTPRFTPLILPKWTRLMSPRCVKIGTA